MMRTFGSQDDGFWTSFRHRRGISDPTRFNLDLTRATAGFEFGGAVGPAGYPSPPMSASPPLPPKVSHADAERGKGTYPTTQDVYRGIPATQGDDRTQTGVAGVSQSFLSDPSERAHYTFPRLEGSTRRPLPYPRQLGQVAAQAIPYLPIPGQGTAANHPGPFPAPPTYSPASPPGIHESLHNPLPKPQRKTMGHVASACVPCKKAHLRFVNPGWPYHNYRSTDN